MRAAFLGWTGTPRRISSANGALLPHGLRTGPLEAIYSMALPSLEPTARSVSSEERAATAQRQRAREGDVRKEGGAAPERRPAVLA